MKTLSAPLKELADWEKLTGALKKKQAVSLNGCLDSQKLHFFYALSEPYPERLILTPDEQSARRIAGEYRFYDRNTIYYPAKDLFFYQADLHGGALSDERLRVLRRLLQKESLTVVTTPDALLTPILPLREYAEHMLTIREGDTVAEEELSGKLTEMGYFRDYSADGTGKFAIRGGIVDVYDPTLELPVRIELWGDEVTSIRSFDPDSQRSAENLKEAEFFPATELPISAKRLENGLSRIKKEGRQRREELRASMKTEEAHRLKGILELLSEEITEDGRPANPDGYIHYFYENTVSLTDLFAGEDAIVLLDEPAHIEEELTRISEGYGESLLSRYEGGYILPGQRELCLKSDGIKEKLSADRTVSMQMISKKDPLVKTEVKSELRVQSMASYLGSFESLASDLTRYRRAKYRVLLLSPSVSRAKRLAKELFDRDLGAFFSEDLDRTLQPSEVMVSVGSVPRGFEYPDLRFAVVSEGDLDGRKKKRKVRQFKGSGISDISDLKPGDYVIHESHGMGIYRGIEKVEVNHIAKDFMKLEYRNGGILYVLASNFSSVQKYASRDAQAKPKLAKLGGREWDRTKSKAREAVNAVARDLVELYAKRQSRKGYEFSGDTVWQKEFEELFPYEETEDQLKAIRECKSDMESPRIMDRLLCGDVGFGKTEVAIRAAFKAVQDNKQVAILVPTTILASQHYQTFKQRLRDFPVSVEMLSRFKSAGEQRGILNRLKKGQVDILIGTHRLLSKDVEFKDLGLLIIDEEQRFGVTHKEKIKKIKADVDVLALSATPIPRTLHMSLAGIRDMSILNEAPEDRMPIQTFVCEYDEEIVREAIRRELSRGGQVYYVYNRIGNIGSVCEKVKALVPEANVSFAHGQMPEGELEGIMSEFVEGAIDVLVSTTIIETGMDIPNVNTLIIHDSERMGLSQLYQLRGRVGRSNRTAYAFLMYRRDLMLKEVAEKRLSAIREFTDLGSGMKVAMRDLEIRGAGNLLGHMQHGHIEAVGYDLYCRMLGEAVKTLKGEETIEDFETAVDLGVDAYIPQGYIPGEGQKLEIYRRIAGLESADELEDMQAELFDRFGKVPRPLTNLLRVSLLRSRAHELYITKLTGGNGSIQILLKEDAKLNAAGIPELLKKIRRLKFSPKPQPSFSVSYSKAAFAEQEESLILELCEKLLDRMKEYLL